MRRTMYSNTSNDKEASSSSTSEIMAIIFFDPIDSKTFLVRANAKISCESAE